MAAFLSKYGVARHIYLPVIKRAVVDFAVSADWTPAAGDVKISKDGGAAANVTNLPTAITMGNTAMWDFSLTATEMQAAQVLVTVSDSATKAVEDTMFEIETHGNASAQFQIDLADGVRAGLTAMPNAAAGASGGLLISGSNSGTTTLAALTVTGSVTLSDGLLVSRSSSNASAITATGNGTGHGAVFTSGSGATGDGVQMTAASTNGRALKLLGTGTGEGLLLNAGATGNGVTIAAGGTSGQGINIATTSGDGINVSGGTNGSGMVLTGHGSGHGLQTTAGTTGGASSMKLDGGNAGLNIAPTNGIGFAVSGGASAVAVQFTGGSGSSGLRVVGGSTSGNGFEAVGTGSGNGVNFNGGATGAGWAIAGGATSGDGVNILTTSGHGILIAAAGASKHGISATGGTSGTSDGAKFVAGSGGVDFRANQTGNLVGTVSTLTTYTGNTPQTGDAFARLGAPAGASVSVDVAAVKADTALIKTATNTGVAPGAASGLAIVGSNMGSVTSVSGAVGSVTAGVTVTTNNDKTGYALTAGERTSIADAHLDRADAIEVGMTPRQAHRLEAAAAAGKLSGAATTTVVIRNAVADSKDRITATVDASGNRSAITTDVT